LQSNRGVACGRAASSQDPDGICAAAGIEIALLLNTAYGEDPTGLQARLGAIAQALNSGDIAKAMIVAVHSRTPELTPEAARSLVAADGELA
jgi:hypothetical protein